MKNSNWAESQTVRLNHWAKKLYFLIKLLITLAVKLNRIGKRLLLCFVCYATRLNPWPVLSIVASQVSADSHMKYSLPTRKNDPCRSIFSLQSNCKFHCQPAPHLTSANFSKLCFCIWLAPPASHKTINILIYLLVENSQNPHRIHFTEKYWNSFQSFSVSVFHKAASTGAVWRSGLKKNKTEKFLWSKNRRQVR